jgi:hypothetical protein
MCHVHGEGLVRCLLPAAAPYLILGRLQTLGRGAWGTVVRGLDLRGGGCRDVAVKFIHWSGEPAELKSLQRELTVLARLKVGAWQGGWRDCLSWAGACVVCPSPRDVGNMRHTQAAESHRISEQLPNDSRRYCM